MIMMHQLNKESLSKRPDQDVGSTENSIWAKLKSRYPLSYLLNRIGSLILVFIVVLILNFLLPHLMPGNYAMLYIRTLEREHPGVDVKVLEQRLDAIYGVGLPLSDQFLVYVREMFSFPPNFGYSFQYYPTPAWTIVFYGLKWTLLLLGSSQAVSWIIGIFFGTWLATKKNKIIDKLSQPIGYFINGMPAFWIAMIAILLFAIYLHIFPTGGAYNLQPTAWSIFYHMLLPMLVIAVSSLPGHALVIRSAAVEAFGNDFVRALKAQGFHSSTIVKRVMKNALLPSVTNLMLSIGYLIGGIYTVEITFSYPGMGYITAQAILNDDYPVIETALYLTTLVILLANLVADLLYPIIDPRVSYAESGE